MLPPVRLGKLRVELNSWYTQKGISAKQIKPMPNTLSLLIHSVALQYWQESMKQPALLQKWILLRCPLRLTHENQQTASASMVVIRTTSKRLKTTIRFLPNILYEYCQCYPNVTLRLKEMYTPHEFNALMHNKIDVGIVRSNELTAPEGDFSS